MNYFKQYKLKNYKWPLVLTLVIISCFSILIVGSAKESVQNRQFFGVILGFIVMVIFSLIDYKLYFKTQWLIYATGIVLLLWVEFFGHNSKGATRWINLGFTTFQPSELVKVFLVLFFAKFFMDNKNEINNWKLLLKSFILFGIPAFLILIQPDLSTTISIVTVFITLIFLTGFDYRTIRKLLLILIPLSTIVFIYILQPNQVLIQDYQQRRVLAWLNPEDYALSEGMQQSNSKIAIGSGQLNGKGLNNNTTTSVKNGNFILEPQTDFIFSIIGEELGFRGCCLVILFLFLVIMQCIMIGIRAQIFAGKLICYGVAAQIAYQSFINMGVASGVLPNTGIPLPFISYGLSSLVCMYIGIGIVLNIGLQTKKYQ